MQYFALIFAPIMIICMHVEAPNSNDAVMSHFSGLPAIIIMYIDFEICIIINTI